MIALEILFVWKPCAGNVAVVLRKFYKNILPNEEKIVEFSVTDYYYNKLNYLQCTSLEIYSRIRVGKQIPKPR